MSADQNVRHAAYTQFQAIVPIDLILDFIEQSNAPDIVEAYMNKAPISNGDLQARTTVVLNHLSDMMDAAYNKQQELGTDARTNEPAAVPHS